MSCPGDDKRPSRVLEHLYIGSRAHAKNRGLLKELGINRILNVTPPRTCVRIYSDHTINRPRILILGGFMSSTVSITVHGVLL